MARLTKKQIDELCDSGSTEGVVPGIHWTGFPNLFVQVRESGPSWIFRYNRKGVNRSMGLGPLREVGYQQAIDEAAKWKALLLTGADPIEVRRAERDPEAPPPGDVVTFRRAARAFIEFASPGWKNDSTEIAWARRLQRYIYPALADRQINTITVDDVAEVVAPLWRTMPPTGRRVLGDLRLILRYAIAMSWYQGLNPADTEASPKLMVLLGPQRHVVTHRRSLDWREVPRFWTALAAESGAAAACLRLIVLTAARSAMVREAVWEEFDFDRTVWTLSPARMKQPRQFRVPLSDAALEVLKAQRPRASGLVFIGPRGKRLTETAPNRVIDRLGFDATPHGFRSSFLDWAREAAGIDREVRELCLAHVEGSQTIRAYARSDLLEPRRTVMTRWAAFVTGQNDA